jgi:hypothetical protein
MLMHAKQQELKVGTYVWVLKSKGQKRRQPSAASPPADQHQRLQLFERARIIVDKQPATTTQRKPECGESNDDDDDEGAKQEQQLLQDPQALPSTGDADDAANVPRVWIQYPKGSTYYIKQNRLLPIIENEHGIILIWPETDVYRKNALQHTLPVGEAFVEIGCDHGATVDRVSRGLGDPTLVLGMDKAADSIASARQRYPQHKFVQWDCLAVGPTKNGVPPELTDLIQRATSWNLALDINGNRELSAVTLALQRLLNDLQLRPRLVFCKSRALYGELLQSSLATER